MQQDLKKVFNQDRKAEKYSPAAGHEDRFLKRLEEELPRKKQPNYLGLKIAAMLLIFLSAGFFLIDHKPQEDDTKQSDEEKGQVVESFTAISLGDLSPDLKKVENYYVATINLELSKLEVSENNKGLIASYMSQLKDLNKDYLKLNTELNQLGPNDQTIAALIQNLQLRLKLLQKLKKKLNDLKTSKNEQIETSTI